jgi:hypothetical protein
VLDDVDPHDENDRRVLIEAEHPEYAAALEDDREVIGPDGSMTKPRLHITVHEVVATQLWADDPPEMGQTAKRLTAAGYDRHEVLHMLCSVVSSELWQALRGEDVSREQLLASLAALSGSWEHNRPTRPPSRAQRRTHRQATETPRNGSPS